MRDVERQATQVADSGRAALLELIGRTKRISAQKPKDKNKLYALHAPEVECLAKGKVRKPYEFGVKMSITTPRKEGLVVGMRPMPGNPYDGYTLAEGLELPAILSDLTPEVAIVDRGYKGVAIDGVKIYHPGLRRGITRGLRVMIRRRSAIEPAIGHMKTDGKLDRNWLKGALRRHARGAVSRRSQPADDPQEAGASLYLHSCCFAVPPRCHRHDGVTPAGGTRNELFRGDSAELVPQIERVWRANM